MTASQIFTPDKMYDVGLGHWLTQKWLRWLRGRRKPRGEWDGFYKGIRMTENRSARISSVICSLFLLAIATVLYFGPSLVDDRHPPELMFVLKIAWVGITFVALLAPLESFNTWVVITDKGLRKRNLFLQQTFLPWSEVRLIERKPDSSDITFKGDRKRKMKINLKFNGWEDLRECANKHLDPVHAIQLTYLIDQK